MNWLNQYRSRLTTADNAVKAVRSGDRVWVHPSCASPEPLLDALLKRSGELSKVEMICMLSLSKADYSLPQYEGHFRHHGLFLGSNVRQAVCEGRADYTPIFP